MAYDPQQFVSNPYGSFDPSQWSNAYSSFNTPGQIPGWPTRYGGVPTDAFGNPLPQFVAAQQAAAAQPAPAATPGTTLNSTPASGQTIQQMVNSAAYQKGPGPPGGTLASASNSISPQMDQLAAWQALTQPEMAAKGDTYGDAYLNSISQGYGGPKATAAPAAAAPSGFNSYQTAIDALSNPGPLKKYGATVPQPTQSGPSVLQNFLNTWQPGASGPGSGFTQGFSKALRGK